MCTNKEQTFDSNKLYVKQHDDVRHLYGKDYDNFNEPFVKQCDDVRHLYGKDYDKFNMPYVKQCDDFRQLLFVWERV